VQKLLPPPFRGFQAVWRAIGSLNLAGSKGVGGFINACNFFARFSNMIFHPPFRIKPSFGHPLISTRSIPWYFHLRRNLGMVELKFRPELNWLCGQYAHILCQDTIQIKTQEGKLQWMQAQY
jgi:hypothetical protein